mgnify:FL=1
MDYCDVDRDGFINYEEFSNFLNYNMPSGIAEAEVSLRDMQQLSPFTLQTNYTTTYILFLYFLRIFVCSDLMAMLTKDQQFDNYA